MANKNTPEIPSHLLDQPLAGSGPRTALDFSEDIGEVTAWQAQPLDSIYAIVFFDALRVNILEEGVVHDKAAYLAIGVRASGHKHVLGVWIEQSERAKFWLHVMNDIKARGTQDILIAVAEDLKQFTEAIAAVFPKAMLQIAISNLIRYSIRPVPWNDRRLVARALQPIYCANSIEGAAVALEFFDQDDWGPKYPEVTRRWRRNWDAIISFFAFPADVRRIIYTTSSIELLKGSVRKAARNKRGFPNDQAAIEVIWLALRKVSDKWKNPPASWRAARKQLATQFKDRFVLSG